MSWLEPCLCRYQPSCCSLRMIARVLVSMCILHHVDVQFIKRTVTEFAQK